MPEARAPPHHQRHRPEQTILYAIVREHLAAFLDLAAERYARPLPKYVARAFAAYLDCGLLERGFLRVHCDACGKDRLVAFSCKQRGLCPSCAARAMCNTAAHLTDRVLPNVPIRQWVLSLPFDLRVPAARDPRLVAACERVLFDAIQRWMRDQLGLARGKAGAVTFVQRFGGSLNLHVHFHVPVLDGLFVRSGGGLPVFLAAPAPTRSDLERVLRDVRDGVLAWIAKHAARDRADEEDPDALAGCAAMATQRGLFADLGGGATRDDDEPTGRSRHSVSLDGFNLHAAVRIGADDDQAREKLVRYCARPAFALERLSVLPDGRIAYAIKTARKGATHRILSPVELLARIAALLPPPRHPFLRYHGVLAPASKWRKDIVPRVIEKAPEEAEACAHPEVRRGAAPPAPVADRREGAPPRRAPFTPLWQRAAPEIAERDPRAITDAHRARLDGGRLLAATPRLDWAKLLRRTYEIDVLVCPQCHGPTRILAAITEPPTIQAILRSLREPPARAPPSGAREPEGDDDDGGGHAWIEPEVDVGE
jgi:hypothetical protein